jgi:hypothetical protein
MEIVLDNAIQIYDVIKARHLNSRFFQLLCNDMCSEHKTSILQTEVCWLSRG